MAAFDELFVGIQKGPSIILSNTSLLDRSIDMLAYHSKVEACLGKKTEADGADDGKGAKQGVGSARKTKKNHVHSNLSDQPFREWAVQERFSVANFR